MYGMRLLTLYVETIAVTAAAAAPAQPVFVSRFDILAEIGAVSTAAIHAAIVEATQYIWDEQAVSAFLLWRTTNDFTPQDT
jgi:hypothetical protein